MVTHKQCKTVLTHYICETNGSRGQEMEIKLLRHITKKLTVRCETQNLDSRQDINLLGPEFYI